MLPLRLPRLLMRDDASTDYQMLSWRIEMLRILTLTAITLVIASCAGTAPQVVEQNNVADPVATGTAAADTGTALESTPETMAKQSEGPKMVCKREKPIGSNIGKRVCRPLGAVSPTSEADKEELRRVQGLSDDDRKLSGD